MKQVLSPLFEKPGPNSIECSDAEPNVQARRKRQFLIGAELLTLATLVALVFICVRPLLEEWALFRAFKVDGLSYVWFGVSHTMRPLHLLPYALQWILGGPWHEIGVAAATVIFLSLRYCAARWAVTPFLNGYGRWVVASMAATLVLWQGAWLGRYMSAQLSTVLFFVALGAAIRLYQQWSRRWMAICVLSVFMLLASYQGLFLCLAAVPFALLLWREEGQPYITTTSKFARICLAIALGGIFYGLYWLTVVKIFGNAMYEEVLASGSTNFLTISGIMEHVEAAIATAYFEDTLVLPFLMGLTYFLCWESLTRMAKSSDHWRMLLLIFVCLILLPVLALIYVSPLHLHDPERVRFPLAVGEVLLAMSLLIHFSVRNLNINRSNSVVIVLVLVVSSAVTAFTVRKDGVLQQSVIKQASVIVKDYNPKSLIVRDMTGELGDVYSLYQTVLQDALLVDADEKVTATICTPLSVDRLHPIARRFPISSTPRCEDLTDLQGQRMADVLVTDWDNGVLRIDAKQ